MAVARIRLTGQVNSDDFLPWIERHAKKLGLVLTALRSLPGCVEIEAGGRKEMLTALALGCSLGPRGVLVDEYHVVHVEDERP